MVDAATPLDGLTDAEHGHPQFLALGARDRALVKAILVTALRFRNTIEAMVAARLHRPLPPNAAMLKHILHVGAAQILFLDVPDSAAVDLAVTHARTDPRSARYAGMVNAVLRGVSRAREAELEKTLAATVDAPDWLAAMLSAAYGSDRAARILAAHRVEPPTDFSVKGDAATWAERLGGFVLPTGSVRLGRLTGPVTDLPGFAEGAWWVQDAAAALPARLLGDIAGKRVADLCAAPGGKTAQLVLAGADVTAVEMSRSRGARLAANMHRLGLAPAIVEADLFDYRPDQPFDAVLLDTPCSSTGTIRRHPDVAWAKTPQDIVKLAELQKRMLAHALTLVRPGGIVVFSNCSLDPREGEELVQALLAESPDVLLDPLRLEDYPQLDGMLAADGMLRTTPADLDLGTPQLSGLDGFFAARLRRAR